MGTATVHATLPHPLPPSLARTHTTTARLLIRPLSASDLAALHALRTQPEVMAWTAAGRVDHSMEETATVLAKFLPPRDTEAFNCAICLKDTGELVGCGGVHRLDRLDRLDRLSCEDSRGGAGAQLAEGGYGWPELGYMFRKEYWGSGMATEFVTAFLAMWEALPRQTLEMRVNAKTIVAGEPQGGVMQVKEVLVAIIDPKNGASHRILDKCGFAKFDVFKEADREDPHKEDELFAFRYFPKAISYIPSTFT